MSPGPYIDCHVHLQDEPLRADDAFFAEMNSLGVTGWLCNATSPADWETVRQLSHREPGVIPCFGVHPWFVETVGDGWLDTLREYLQATPSPVGEIGLDRLREPRDEARQQTVFLAQLELAHELNRPVMIHCVKAWEWLMDLLRNSPGVPGLLLHGFGGAADLIEPLAAMGAYFSFSGSALNTYHKRARAALAAVPADRLLIETDAPALMPPEAYRLRELADETGHLYNHPANLVKIYEGLAELRHESPQQLARTVWQNARRLLAPLNLQGVFR